MTNGGGAASAAHHLDFLPAGTGTDDGAENEHEFPAFFDERWQVRLLAQKVLLYRHLAFVIE
jgi:hypothetical protein